MVRADLDVPAASGDRTELAGCAIAVPKHEILSKGIIAPTLIETEARGQMLHSQVCPRSLDLKLLCFVAGAIALNDARIVLYAPTGGH